MADGRERLINWKNERGMRNLNQISGDDFRQIYCFTLTILTNAKFTSWQNREGIAIPQDPNVIFFECHLKFLIRQKQRNEKSNKNNHTYYRTAAP